MEQREVTDALQSAITAALHDHLAPYGLRSVEIRPETDHDGDPILLIEAHYGESDQPLDSRETYAAGKAVRRLVHDHGETRFPHIRHLFSEDHPVAS